MKRPFYFYVLIVFLPGVIAGIALALPAMASSHDQLYQSAMAILQKESPSDADMQEALSMMTQAAELMPNDFRYAYNSGYISAQLYKWLQADAWFKKARNLASNSGDLKDTDVWLKVCSEKNYQASVSVSPSDPLASESRARFYYELKSAGMGPGNNRDRMESPHPQLVHIAAGDENDTGLKAFFRKGFPN